MLIVSLAIDERSIGLRTKNTDLPERL